MVKQATNKKKVGKTSNRAKPTHSASVRVGGVRAASRGTE